MGTGETVLEIDDQLLEVFKSAVTRTYRIAWSVDDNGNMLSPNHLFCVVMGYAFEEADHHPATRLLRPNAQPHDPELLAIIAGMVRLKNGETKVEHIRNTWIETRSGQRIPIPEAVMVRSPFQPRYEVHADINIGRLKGGLRTAVRMAHQQQVMQRWQLEELNRKVAVLQEAMADMRAYAFPERAIREVAREVAQEELLEHDVSNVLMLKPAKPRKKRSDQGERRVYDDDADFEEDLRAVLSRGHVTVQQVLAGTRINHPITLKKYLKPYAKPDETPGKTIRRLGLLWYPDNHLL